MAMDWVTSEIANGGPTLVANGGPTHRCPTRRGDLQVSFEAPGRSEGKALAGASGFWARVSSGAVTGCPATVDTCGRPTDRNL